MTTQDVGEIVLDAFRIEHREQLDQIRALLGGLEPGADVVDDGCVQEAFRLAHSFKGGARVCDLRDAERLGHGLETILERLGRGDLSFTEDVMALVNLVLDTIEDWMAALDGQQAPPDTAGPLAALERVISGRSGIIRITQEPSGIGPMLLEVFRKEYAQHRDTLRQLLIQTTGDRAIPSSDQIAAAGRAAHTLAGAAAAVQLHGIETQAHSLEKLFRAIGEVPLPFDADAQRQLEDRLGAMDDALCELESNTAVGKTAVHAGEHGVDPGRPEAVNQCCPKPASRHGELRTVPAATTPAHETVRVSVQCLDRLMRSSSAMLAENRRVSHLTRQLNAFQLELDDLEREREGMRRVASSRLHQLAAIPEFSRITRYLEYVDRQVNNLARCARRLSVEQRRTAWLMETRCAQVQRDVHEARMIPAHSVFQGFRKMVRDLAKSEGKQIDFQVTGMDVRADRMVLQALKDPLMHVLRNSVTHGIEDPRLRREAGKPEIGHVSLSFGINAGRLQILVDDDGRGIDTRQIARQAVRRGLLTESDAARQSNEELLLFAFRPGVSTVDSVTELAGRGMGLSIVHDSVARLQGQVKFVSREGGGARTSLSVPISVTTHRVLLAASGNQTIAIPTRGIERLLRLSADNIDTVEGQPVVMHQRRPIRMTRLCDLLGWPESATAGDKDTALTVILLKSGSRFLGVTVDALFEERDALIMNLDEFAESSLLAGGILLEDGQVALVVQPAELMERIQHGRRWSVPEPVTGKKQAGAVKVLIVDDSFTTRTLEKSILESQGYQVSVAVDGAEALSRLRQESFSLVVSDIEMPRMDGLALLEEIKADRRLANIPVILVTSRDKQEDQRRGLDLGAEAYIVKRKFDHEELITTIQQVL